MKKLTLAGALLLGILSSTSVKAQASDPFLGQIAFVPYNFVPKFGLPVTVNFSRSHKTRHYFHCLELCMEEMERLLLHYQT